jgi:hypothetical protein
MKAIHNQTFLFDQKLFKAPVPWRMRERCFAVKMLASLVLQYVVQAL